MWGVGDSIEGGGLLESKGGRIFFPLLKGAFKKGPLGIGGAQICGFKKALGGKIHGLGFFFSPPLFQLAGGV